MFMAGRIAEATTFSSENQVFFQDLHPIFKTQINLIIEEKGKYS